MDPLSRYVTKGGVHHPLALQSRHACKRRAFNLDGEVRFAAAIIAGMATVPGAVIDNGTMDGGESFG